MSNILTFFITLTAGIVLGLFYFGTLWMNIRYLSAFDRPEWVMLVSFLFRSALLITGFFLVTGGQWMRLLTCVAGFTVMRFYLVKRVQPKSVETPLTRGW